MVIDGLSERNVTRSEAQEIEFRDARYHRDLARCAKERGDIIGEETFSGVR